METSVRKSRLKCRDGGVEIEVSGRRCRMETSVRRRRVGGDTDGDIGTEASVGGVDGDVAANTSDGYVGMEALARRCRVNGASSGEWLAFAFFPGFI